MSAMTSAPGGPQQVVYAALRSRAVRAINLSGLLFFEIPILKPLRGILPNGYSFLDLKSFPTAFSFPSLKQRATASPSQQKTNGSSHETCPDNSSKGGYHSKCKTPFDRTFKSSPLPTSSAVPSGRLQGPTVRILPCRPALAKEAERDEADTSWAPSSSM